MAQREHTTGFWGKVKHAFAIPATELSTRERGWLDSIAQRVVQRGLTTPALMILGTVRPLNFVGSQVLVFFRPIIALAVPPERCDEAARLLEKRGSIEALMRLIEDYESQTAAETRHQPVDESVRETQ